jgi:hypothetical protein
MGPVGLFKKMKNEAGIPSPELMRRGMLASGWIVDLEKTDLWVGHGIQPDRELRAPVAATQTDVRRACGTPAASARSPSASSAPIKTHTKQPVASKSLANCSGSFDPATRG